MNPHPWLEIAESKLGEHEVSGPEANSFIVECLESTTLGSPENQSDETAWCSAFVGWCLEQAGVESTHSAWARSYLEWGKEVDDPSPGAIVVFERGSNSGHVAFFVQYNPDNEMVQVLGGNQSDSVSLAWFPWSRVIGVREPV
jgi:uncharacterized protein (TIGR02594 family)